MNSSDFSSRLPLYVSRTAVLVGPRQYVPLIKENLGSFSATIQEAEAHSARPITDNDLMLDKLTFGSIRTRVDKIFLLGELIPNCWEEEQKIWFAHQLPPARDYEGQMCIQFSSKSFRNCTAFRRNLARSHLFEETFFYVTMGLLNFPAAFWLLHCIRSALYIYIYLFVILSGGGSHAKSMKEKDIKTNKTTQMTQLSEGTCIEEKMEHKTITKTP